MGKMNVVNALLLAVAVPIGGIACSKPSAESNWEKLGAGWAACRADFAKTFRQLGSDKTTTAQERLQQLTNAIMTRQACEQATARATGFAQYDE